MFSDIISIVSGKEIYSVGKLSDFEPSSRVNLEESASNSDIAADDVGEAEPISILLSRAFSPILAKSV